MADFKKIEEKIKKFAVKDDAFIWNLDEAVKYLENAILDNKNIYITFSGKELYSLLDDRDSCYLKVTGETYEQFNAELEKEKRDFAVKKMKIDGWVARGKEVVEHSEYEKWVDYVYENAYDASTESQIESALSVMERLANGCNVADVNQMLDNEERSDASYVLTMSLIKDFCPRAEELVGFKTVLA